MGGLVFELEATKDYPPRRRARAARWILLAFAAIINGYALYGVVSISIRGSWTVAGVVAFVLVGLVCILFIRLAVGYIPQAQRIQVNVEGLILTYPSGGLRIIKWTAPPARVVLERAEPLATPDVYPHAMSTLRGNRPFQTYLTEDAFGAITRQAQASGLTVQQSAARRPGWIRWTIRR